MPLNRYLAADATASPPPIGGGLGGGFCNPNLNPAMKHSPVLAQVTGIKHICDNKAFLPQDMVQKGRFLGKQRRPIPSELAVGTGIWTELHISQ
jgi:hypothetical protein